MLCLHPSEPAITSTSVACVGFSEEFHVCFPTAVRQTQIAFPVLVPLLGR